MSDRIVTLPNKVRSAYENLLEAFRETVESANQTVSFPDRPIASCFTDSGTGATVAFKRCLYLKGWPCRKLSGSKRLDVVLMAHEEIAKRSWVLKLSTVHLNYFVVSNTTVLLVQSLHYDFKEGGQAGHPLFHVHLTHELIDEGELRSAGFNLASKVQGTSNECWVTRIPTSDMTLASVLYCLVADHLESGFFSQFAERMRPIQEQLPPPSFDPLKKSIEISSAHFKISHWFAHMFSTT